MMLARSHSTPGHSQVAPKLVMICRHRLDHGRIEPVGNPIKQVLVEDDR
jgi:hypothetical protein